MAEKSKNFSDKEVIMFDLDGTLTESKSVLDDEMADLFCRLLGIKKVAVIGGGDYPQFKKQFLDYLDCEEDKLSGLLVFPTSGARLYKLVEGSWKMVYEHSFDEKEKERIMSSFEKALEDVDYNEPDKTYGEVIEDRNTQITFSALGQNAPLEKKEEWNKNFDVRESIQKALKKYLSNFEVRLGGLTSIDVTQKGIDKAYGVEEVMERFGADKEDIVYVGDALYEGGNDEAVKRTGIDTLQVDSYEETKTLIKGLLEK